MAAEFFKNFGQKKNMAAANLSKAVTARGVDYALFWLCQASYLAEQNLRLRRTIAAFEKQCK